MYHISLETELSSAHKLILSYDSKCQNIHGHNWKVIIHCKSDCLNKDGMIIDYTEIKNIVSRLDHKFLNDVITINPTAENLCKFICSAIPFCHKVEIKEADKSWACYEL